MGVKRHTALLSANVCMLATYPHEGHFSRSEAILRRSRPKCWP